MKKNNPNNHKFIEHAKQAIETEKEALELLIDELDERFIQACNIIFSCKGRLVITGMGKSGLIGRKMASTFASTGTPSFFIHPGEAGHGDLGMLVEGDVLIAISNSGNSNEIKTLLPVIKHLKVPLISISRDNRGFLPESADIALTLGLSEEACPLGLAPTSSTTATLALGDALAVALLQERDFTSEDFAMSHPAGALGKKLLTSVADLMHDDLTTLPKLLHDSSIKQALFTMTKGMLGMAVIVDEMDKVVGVFTDGDLRRSFEKNIDIDSCITAVMIHNPKAVHLSMRASDALTVMKKESVNQLLVLSKDSKLDGIVTLHDMIKAGVK